MGWNAVCVQAGVPVLFTRLGSAGFTVDPANEADCFDDDAGRYCVPNRTGRCG